MAKRKRENKGHYKFMPKPTNVVPATKTVYLKNSDPEIESIRSQVYAAYQTPPPTPAFAKDLDLSRMKRIGGLAALSMRGQYWRLIKISDNGDRGLTVVVETEPVEEVQ